MNKKIGLFWLRDDFRLAKNKGLIEATSNHDQVVVFYLYKEDGYKDQEAQKWWLSKSLLNFRKKLNDFNITLEIVETNSFKFFFDKLIKKKDFTIYWNKVYEPDYLKFDEYLSSNLKKNSIDFKRFKGNALNEIEEIKISSTKVRSAIEKGNIHLVNDYCGHFYEFSGEVVRGNGIGKTINDRLKRASKY